MQAGSVWIGGFVHPALAVGAALAVVPLLIHLLNRQRYRPMPWAAMRFVRAAWRRTRRRTRLENLLLLLLRMAGIALLALAVARPFAGGESPLAALTESRRDLVLLLDGSASTGWRGTTRSVFEDIVERARMHLGELDAGRGDRVRLLLCGDHPRLLSWRSPEEAFSLLSTLSEPTDERLDFAAALGEVLRFAEEDARASGECTLEIRLLTDLQRSSFDPGLEAEGTAGAGSEATARVAELLDRLRALGGRVLLEDLGPAEPQPANLSVGALELFAPALGARLPVEVALTVENFGPQVRAAVRIGLEVDGERRQSRLVDVPARGEARVQFELVFDHSGAHALAARLEPDQLAVDDVRVRVVHVPPPVRVLLVDGAPAFEVDQDETGLLALVLEPPRGDGPAGPEALPAPFAVHVIEPSRLRSDELDLAAFDVIVLANVGSLDAATAARLEARVAAGAALLVTAGDELAASAATWNTRLFEPDGSGLLPAELGSTVAVSDRRRDWWRVREFREDHPALSFFADERWRPLLTEVPVYAFLSARPLADAKVLARLDDEGSSPLLIERAFDRGKVFLWLTTIDPAWARVAESPRTLVPLAHELVRYGGSPPQPPRNLPVGGAFVAEVDSYPQAPMLLRPDGSRRVLSGEPVAVAAGVWRLPAVEETERVGLYKIEIEGAPALPFAVDLDPAESDLERLDAGSLSALHPALTLVTAGSGPERALEDDPAARGELWRALALACLAALVAESAWAAWIGRHRSSA